MAPAYRSHTTKADTQPTIQVDAPAGIVAGDLLLAVLAFYMPSSSTDVTTVPSGWTLLRTVNNHTARNQRASVYWKIASGSEPANWTFTTDNAIAHGAASGCLAISDPVDLGGGDYVSGDSGQIDAGSSVNHPAAAVTAASADDLLIYLGFHRDGTGAAWAWTPPSGYTERYDFADTTTNNNIAAATKTAGAAGSSGTVTGVTANACQGAAILIAVNGSAPPPPPSGTFTHIKFGTGLTVTDEGGGVIRVDVDA